MKGPSATAKHDYACGSSVERQPLEFIAMDPIHQRITLGLRRVAADSH